VPFPSPRFSVVIPAHDEESTLPRSLTFVTELEPGEAEVVVVANGCTDRTADVARTVPGVQVVELAQGGKAAALNAGDAVVTAFPRVYLDADISMGAPALRRLAEVTSVPEPVVAAPRVVFRTDARPWPVRAFYQTYERLPYIRDGLVGLGVYAVSEAGRRRFDVFPEVTADDLFVQRLFCPQERVALEDASFAVEVPRSLRQLVAVRTRTAFGNRQLAEHEPTAFGATTKGTSRALVDLARRDPRSWPGVAVYTAVTLAARRRSRGRRGGVWHRDASTRTAATPPARDARCLRTGYLVSEYPALSHEFVAREVRALRALGGEVRTFTVRPPGLLRTDADHAEAAATPVLLESPLRLLAAQARLLARRPSAWVAGLRTALRSGHGGPRGRVRQLFYFAEASLLARHMEQLGLQHLHVHFANNSADIARIAVAIGSGGRTEAWSWSLAMHGPTEFFDVERFGLADKVRSARFVACISDYCRSQLMALVEPEHWPKLHLVRMSVDPDRYPPMMEQRRARENGPLRVLFVGRLVPEKGPEVLLDAVAAMSLRTELRVVGDGPLRDVLTARVERLGLSHRVVLTGPLGQDELPEQYAWADAFCLPSFAEGLPVVLMEAMSTGLPVVTTRVAGIPELVENEASGLIVSPGRPDLVARALTALAENPELRFRLGAAAAEMVHAAHMPGPNAAVLARLITD
jgi:colanic acid/amylovoran biosynthesis glycosyltransferase